MSRTFTVPLALATLVLGATPARAIHDGVPTDHGTILYLSDQVETVSNYPTS